MFYISVLKQTSGVVLVFMDFSNTLTLCKSFEVLLIFPAAQHCRVYNLSSYPFI